LSEEGGHRLKWLLRFFFMKENSVTTLGYYHVLAGKQIGAGLATIGMTGAGVGVGVIFGMLILGLSRNPEVEGLLFRYTMLGFAITEAIGLLCLIVGLIILYG
jgi:F-type H+-transporting ATPase subunit c